MFNSLRITIKCWQCVNSMRSANPRMLIQVKNYGDFVYRHPVRIVNEEEILEKVEEADGPNEYFGDDERKKFKSRKQQSKSQKTRPKKKIVVKETDTFHKEDGRLNYIELKEDDRILTALMMSVRSRKTRDRHSRIILEGHRLISDAIEAGSIPEIVVFSRFSDVQKLPLPEVGVKLYKTPYRAIQTWTTLTTSPGLMAFFQMPDVENIEPAPDALPLTIICDNVREPGNMGSILRACAAVGCKRLILIRGCVDVWDPKVLRSAAGAHFRMPITAYKNWREVWRMIDLTTNIYVADNNPFASETGEGDEEEKEILSENEAIEREIENESLNNSPEVSLKSDDLENSQDEIYRSILDDPVEFKNHNERKRDSKLVKKLMKNIPVIPYYSTSYRNSENVIIVGGETEGVSLEALALVHERNGIRVNIPMTNGVDSLNTGMALGIIAFEIKRQYSVEKANKNNDETS